MGREVRMVPANWGHPAVVYSKGEIRFVPLLGGSFSADAARYVEEKAKWERGEFPSYATEESRKLSFDEWDGSAPRKEDYMPEWSPKEATHLMMYETCSEGTPISPAFSTPEELAHWLARTGASSFGSDTASYESWLRVCRGGFAPSAVFIPGQCLVNGVDATNAMEAQP